jgi:hypothetical protein
MLDARILPIFQPELPVFLNHLNLLVIPIQVDLLQAAVYLL